MKENGSKAGKEGRKKDGQQDGQTERGNNEEVKNEWKEERTDGRGLVFIINDKHLRYNIILSKDKANGSARFDPQEVGGVVSTCLFASFLCSGGVSPVTYQKRCTRRCLFFSMCAFRREFLLASVSSHGFRISL